MRTLVLIPTYNERDNLPLIVRRLRDAVPDADLLVLDDSSPDGTGDVADALAAADDRVRVLHRRGKEGLGAAYLAGFRQGLAEGYDVLVEIDADGSHQPEQLPSLLAELADPDVALVIGSRWVPGGGIVNWPWHRKLLSVGGNAYIQVMLGMPVRDATAGFRAYRADTLRRIGLHDVESLGYCFQTDLTWRTARAGLAIREVPITFVEREIGDSKMNGDIVRESMLRITRWGLSHRGGQLRALAPAPRTERWESL
ncbi:polyprenol monophosphomannose synthase [Arsenicicoccus sp. oral taxon 190]|uniref:polyprenol monophosphomannose synthase n=1 Tax=Arsenicicoccus sp. oral taxon 190 TaxID=1658671 RepID=UPI00067A0EBF|nr:polyprenol monophosphomannose synthase [Arsenicicoccus sp. oral taxon 190]AKT51889.1 dolichol-phosphate mannosyltransferase [Arsenicicoccus sp. oral taxon 190]